MPTTEYSVKSRKKALFNSEDAVVITFNDKGRFGRSVSFGVPKHSELEPDYSMA
jgi:hypothetical protein